MTCISKWPHYEFNPAKKPDSINSDFLHLWCFIPVPLTIESLELKKKCSGCCCICQVVIMCNMWQKAKHDTHILHLFSHINIFHVQKWCKSIFSAHVWTVSDPRLNTRVPFCTSLWWDRRHNASEEAWGVKIKNKQWMKQTCQTPSFCGLGLNDSWRVASTHAGYDVKSSSAQAADCSHWSLMVFLSKL